MSIRHLDRLVPGARVRLGGPTDRFNGHVGTVVGYISGFVRVDLSGGTPNVDPWVAHVWRRPEDLSVIDRGE